MTPEQMLIEVLDVLRSMPARGTLGHQNDDNHAWFGRAAAIVHAWDKTSGMAFDHAHNMMHIGVTGQNRSAQISIMLTMLRRMEATLSLQVRGPLTTIVDRGKPFDYFEGVRDILSTATQDVLFVDPYLDAEFVARFLPLIKDGVSIRLLADKAIKTLVPAVTLYATSPHP